MNKPIQLVVAGAGLIGKQHIERIQLLDETNLLAIVDPAAQTQALCQELGCLYFADLDSMFAACQPDGVLLATPTPLHVALAETCINHQCPVLIEKPIAISTAEAQQIVDSSQASQVPVLIGHHRRHSPLIQSAKELIVAGEIGQIRALNMQCWLYKPDDYFEVAPWRKRKGAGPLSVNLVHDIDLARYLCGEVICVHTMSHQSSRGFENEDTAAAVLQFNTGVVATVSVSDSIVSPWSWEMTARENTAYPPVQQSSYQIGGSYGSLSVPDLTLWHNNGERSWWNPICATNPVLSFADPLVNQLKHFCQVIAGTVPPLVSAEEGLKSLRVIEALQQSAVEQRTITIEQ